MLASLLPSQESSSGFYVPSAACGILVSWSGIEPGLPQWKGFPGGSETSACQCSRCGLGTWVKKLPWRRNWQHTPVFLSGKSHGQRSLVGYCSWSRRVKCNLATKHHHQSTESIHWAARECPCWLMLNLHQVLNSEPGSQGSLLSGSCLHLPSFILTTVRAQRLREQISGTRHRFGPWGSGETDVKQRVHSSDRGPRFEDQVCLLLAVWSWASYFTPLCLSHFLC